MLPAYGLDYLHEFTGDLILQENLLMFILVIVISVIYYSAFIKNLDKLVGYLNGVSILKYCLGLYVSLWILIFIFAYLQKIFLDFIGVTSIDNTPNFPMEDFYQVASIIILFLHIIWLIVLTYKIFTRKYEYKNNYTGKEKTVEEYKAILSPAALKVYEKKDTSHQENK